MLLYCLCGKYNGDFVVCQVFEEMWETTSSLMACKVIESGENVKGTTRGTERVEYPDL